MDPDPTLPDNVGPFQIERRLGEGGMGVVYLGANPAGRLAAVKVIKAELAGEAGFRKRFAREVAAAKAVSGAYTAAVLDFDTHGPLPWLATEFVDAPTLDRQVRTDGPLDADQVWLLAYGLADALRNIHQASIAHRDLKPANVLMAQAAPKVIDFGISRLPDLESLTTTGHFMGTPRYMAPEQWMAPGEVGPAADVFALGAVLVFASTGHGPFDSDHDVVMGYNAVYQPPNLSGVPDSLAPIVSMCLSKDPSDRPSPDRILQLLGRRGERRRLPLNTRQAPAMAGRRKLSGRHLAVALAGALLLAGSGTWIWAQSGHAHGIGKASSSTASPSLPLLEPAAALRPRGWALWSAPATGNGVGEMATTPRCVVYHGGLDCLSDTEFQRLDLASGKVLRTVQADPPRSSSSSRFLIGFAPATGVVLYASHGCVDSISGGRHMTRRGPATVYAYDAASGALIWTQPHMVDDCSPITVLPPSSLHTITVDDDGILVALDPSNGAIEWQQVPETGYQPATATSTAVLLIPNWKIPVSTVRGLSPNTGKTLWQAKVPTGTALFAVDDQTGASDSIPLLISTYPRGDATVDGLQFSGIDYFKTTNATVTSVKFQQPLMGTVIATPTLVVAQRPDGQITAVRTTDGKIRWTRSLSAAPGDGTGPVYADGRIYVPTSTGQVTCLDAATGTPLWISAIRNDTSQAVAETAAWLSVSDGHVVSETNTGSVYTLMPPVVHLP
ncbi:hypothetical protein DN069_07850 [Streptacidiphilus pinicola]|uniref:Protein kinase domain-containing protein n=1 Tax=Streptacidiphilus pinicola TaxID=2219663 RepID=A0A2X0KHE2_9ACTN|nr:serine/threonine-protein kinase [Streptacidiphilus pinicola]RAG86180.1 hypothetical protein DN069_07850 [Streptacidiphilus pinicola]